MSRRTTVRSDGQRAPHCIILLYELFLVKLSGGRIVEARVNHLIQDRDGIKLQVDFGHDETALIELWQVLED